MRQNSTKTVVATGIGAALFIIVGIFINIPIFGNTSIQLQYAIQSLFSVVFGPIAGFLIGFIGHMIKDGYQYGSISWAWVLASGLIGLGIGLFRRYYDASKGKIGLKEIIIFNLVQVLTNAIAYLVVCPIGDRLMYQQAWNYLLTQGLVAGIANSLTIAVGGTILLVVYAKTRVQSGSLSKD